MNNHNETDRILRDKLGQYDSGAPMHLFDRIEEGMAAAPEKKKRTGMWWWSMGLLLFLMVGTKSWYFIYNNKNTKSVTSSDLTVPTPQEALGDDKIITTSKVTTVVNNNTNTSTDNLSKTINKVPALGLTSKKAIAADSKVLENKIITTENHQVTNEEQFVSEPQPTPTITLFSKGKISTDSPLTMAEKTERKSILTAQKKEEAFGQQVPTLVDLNLKYNAEFQLPDIVKCGDKKDRGLNWNVKTSMDLFVSPERSFRFLEYKSDDYAEHAMRRNETEKAYYSFSSGLRFNFLTESGLAVRTGLVYSQINEIFEDQFLVSELLTNPITGDTIGFTQYLNDVTTFNRYKMVDVPLMIGYEMPMKRSTLNVNAGVFINVKSMQKGTLLDVEGTKRDFTTGAGDYEIFRKNIGVSYFMSLGAAYDLSRSYQFFFEPHLRYYPGSFAKKEYALNQKYVTGGIMIGIRKKL